MGLTSTNSFAGVTTFTARADLLNYTETKTELTQGSSMTIDLSLGSHFRLNKNTTTTTVAWAAWEEWVAWEVWAAWVTWICKPAKAGIQCRAKPRVMRGFVIVRPAWARSWGGKSSRELATANEAKCNCARATERGKEAWSETASRWTRIGYEATLIRASRQ